MPVVREQQLPCEVLLLAVQLASRRASCVWTSGLMVPSWSCGQQHKQERSNQRQHNGSSLMVSLRAGPD
jgi:hypothetical protein